MKMEREFSVQEETDTLLLTPSFMECPFHGTLLEGVEMSIKKWQCLEEHYVKENKEEYIREMGRSTCALCDIFLAKQERFGLYPCTRGEHKCPIYAYTGYCECLETPYQDYVDEDYLGASGENLLSLVQEEIALLEKVKQSVIDNGTAGLLF